MLILGIREFDPFGRLILVSFLGPRRIYVFLCARFATHFIISEKFTSARIVSVAKVVAFIKNHYTKSYVINQQELPLPFLSPSQNPIACLDYAPAREKKLLRRG